jgi:hypothetical protein
MPTLASYLALITSKHQNKPKYAATLTAILQPFVETQTLLLSMPLKYDLDTAEGVQLDAVGLWIGLSRYVASELPNTYFSFDDADLGFDLGNWKGRFDPSGGVVRLDDFNYRLLLRAKIAANNWDGTMQGAFDGLTQVFAAMGATVVIEDNQDMTMTIAITGALPTAVIRAILAEGYLPFKPEGVRVNYLVPSIAGPLFAFDVDSAELAGFDSGVWAIPA